MPHSRYFIRQPPKPFDKTPSKARFLQNFYWLCNLPNKNKRYRTAQLEFLFKKWASTRTTTKVFTAVWPGNPSSADHAQAELLGLPIFLTYSSMASPKTSLNSLHFMVLFGFQPFIFWRHSITYTIRPSCNTKKHIS